jgi:hypothetical protein
MPIILAIEPDRRQRAALDAVVRHRIGAELILADTTEHALDAIGDRVPDLVLVPALLAPQDDAALAAALRVIAAASHVRTLTIPVLASEVRKTPKAGGLLSRWRRGRDEPTAPDGCDPAVFAEQVTAYLAEAAAARAELHDDERQEEAPRAADRRFEPAVATAAEPSIIWDEPIVVEQTGVVRDVPVVVADEQVLMSEELVVAADQPALLVDDPVLVREEVAVPFEESMFVAASKDDDDDAEEEDIDLSAELENISDEETDAPTPVRDGTALFDGEPVGVYTMPSLDDAVAIDVHELESLDLESPRRGLREITSPAWAAHAAAADAETVDPYVDEAQLAESIAAEAAAADRRALEAIEALEAVQALVALEAHKTHDVHEAEEARETQDAYEAQEPEAPTVDAPALVAAADEFDILAEFSDDAEPDAADVEPWMAAALARPYSWPTIEGAPAEIFLDAPRPVVDTPRPAVDSPRPVVETPRPPATPAARDRAEWTELVASLRQDIERRRAEPAPLEAPPPKPKRQPKKAKPVQDEWGFFDPEQCGFAALLAKLDEITDGQEDADARRH